MPEEKVKPKATTLCLLCDVEYPDTMWGFVQHVESLPHQSNLLVAELRKLNGKFLAYPTFDSIETCPKCNYWFLSSIHKRPATWYNSAKNVVKRTCPGCGYSWEERCADGTEPIK